MCFQRKHSPISFSAFPLWLCSIAASNQCAVRRTTCFPCRNMAPWSFPHEEFLRGSNDSVFICSHGTDTRKLLCGCPSYCRFWIFIEIQSINFACAICSSMGNCHVGFLFPMTSSLGVRAFILWPSFLLVSWIAYYTHSVIALIILQELLWAGQLPLLCKVQWFHHKLIVAFVVSEFLILVSRYGFVSS